MPRPQLPFGLYALTDPELLPEPSLGPAVAAMGWSLGGGGTGGFLAGGLAVTALVSVGILAILAAGRAQRRSRRRERAGSAPR